MADASDYYPHPHSSLSPRISHHAARVSVSATN